MTSRHRGDVRNTGSTPTPVFLICTKVNPNIIITNDIKSQAAKEKKSKHSNCRNTFLGKYFP
jgi:hypothetical protein